MSISKSLKERLVVSLADASVAGELEEFINDTIAEKMEQNQLEADTAALKAASDAKIIGTVALGDTGAGAGALAVTGNIVSASKIVPAADKTTVTINFPETINPRVFFTVESLGDVDNDNNYEHPIILSLSSTSVEIYFHEIGATIQDLRLHVMILPE